MFILWTRISVDRGTISIYDACLFVLFYKFTRTDEMKAILKLKDSDYENKTVVFNIVSLSFTVWEKQTKDY